MLSIIIYLNSAMYIYICILWFHVVLLYLRHRFVFFFFFLLLFILNYFLWRVKSFRFIWFTYCTYILIYVYTHFVNSNHMAGISTSSLGQMEKGTTYSKHLHHPNCCCGLCDLVQIGGHDTVVKCSAKCAVALCSYSHHAFYQ